MKLYDREDAHIPSLCVSAAFRRRQACSQTAKNMMLLTVATALSILPQTQGPELWSRRP